MNWNQLHASATEEEKLEATLLMLRVIEERQNKRIVARGRLITERRGHFPGAHFINDRRRNNIPQPIMLASFLFTIFTISIGVWITFFYLPPAYAAPLMLLHLVTFIAILMIKPYRRVFAY